MPDLHDSSYDQADDPTNMDLLKLIWTVRQTAARVFEPLGFTPLQALMLELIARGSTRPKPLAGTLGIHTTALSTMLLQCENRFLLERRRVETDARSVEITLSTQGKEAVTSIRQAWVDADAFNLAALSEDEAHEFLRIIRQLLPDY